MPMDKSPLARGFREWARLGKGSCVVILWCCWRGRYVMLLEYFRALARDNLKYISCTRGCTTSPTGIVTVIGAMQVNPRGPRVEICGCVGRSVHLGEYS